MAGNNRRIGESKAKISIEELQPGMKVGRDIEYDFGGVLIPEGTILNQQKIERLQGLGTKNVYIYKENKLQIEDNLKRIKDAEINYQKQEERMKNMFKMVRKNRGIEYEEVKDLTYEVSTVGNDQDMISLLTKVREADEYTYSHLLNVGMLAYMFGNWLDMEEKESLKITQSGLLHDIGKAFIPDEILNKPGKLTADEYETMKKHSVYGYYMARDNENIPPAVSQGILTHHERYDGQGYPLQIRGKKIPFFGRILGIVDTFDAITANRIYQPSSSPFEAIKLFHEQTLGAFDYQLVKIFLDNIPNYFVDEEVKLNDGRKAKIVFINPRHPDRPIINVDGDYIDLYNNSDLEIDRLADGSEI